MQKEVMLKIINDQSQARKKKLADALFEVGTDEAIDGLYRLLNDKSDFVVLFATERLGDLALNNIQINIKPIIDTLTKYQNKDYIKMACVRALGYSKNPVAIKTLIDALRDTHAGVRYYAIDAITKFGLTATLPLINGFTEEVLEWNSRLAFALALTFLSTLKGSDVEITLKNVLTIKSENVKYAAIRAFEEIGNISLSDKLKQFLKIDTTENRNEIRKMVKNISKKEEMEQLIKQLTVINQQLCIDLVMALKNQKDVETSKEIIEKILDNCEDKKTKAIIIRIIGLSKAKFAVPLLTSSIKDPDKRVRANAVEALAELGNEDVIEIIKPALNDFDNRVKANAAKGLWKLGGARSLQILRDMITSSDKWMRASAAYALGEIGVIQATEILQNAINDPDNDVKINVIKSLGKIGDINSIQILCDIVKNKVEDWNVRKNAIIALSKSNSEDAHQFLLNEKDNESETELYKETISIVLEERFGKDYEQKIKKLSLYEDTPTQMETEVQNISENEI